MRRLIRPALSAIAIALYLLVLRFIAPSDQPYFILGIGIMGLVSWLMGTVAGLITAVLLIPATQFIYGQFPISTSYMSFARAPAYIALEIMAVVSLGILRKKVEKLSSRDATLAEGNHQLLDTLAHVQELGGIHNLCSTCKKIQEDNGTWKEIDHYLKEKSKMEFSHCICPDCAEHFNDKTESDDNLFSL